jgi:hypothetical protein
MKRRVAEVQLSEFIPVVRSRRLFWGILPYCGQKVAPDALTPRLFSRKKGGTIIAITFEEFSVLEFETIVQNGVQ